MHYTISVDREAYQDIKEAVIWYNEQQIGLGNIFIDRFELISLFLQKTPLVFRIRYLDTRKAAIGEFPYFIHYVVDENNKSIRFLAVLHGSRNPQIWNKRV